MNYERATKIAALLGYTIEPLHPEHGDYGRYSMSDPEGRDIGLTRGSSGADKGRIIVCGQWPSFDGTKWGHVISPSQVDEESPRITIAASKTDEQVVSDIQRRFLSDFQRIYDKCKDRGASEVATNKAQVAMKQVIADEYGKHLSDGEMAPDTCMHLYGLPKGSFRDVTVASYNHTVSGQFSSIPLDVFLNLIKLLKGEKP